ncbi:MAG: hypothetical protein EOO88_36370, partial [Pedobacter sp.]
YLYAEYNKGRTTVHELGHFFGLRHIWADDTNPVQTCPAAGACAATDFPGAPAGQDDTPNQCAANFGNPDPTGTGVVLTDFCTPTAPGINYQNFMDYCDDTPLVMFTKGQGARMEGFFTSPDRGPLLTSTAYLPPTSVPGNDAKISAIISPANNATLGCGTTVTPQVTVQNVGATPLSSALINVRVNGIAVGSPFAWTAPTPLTIGQTANVTLPAVTLGLGASVIKIHTSLPNGVTDATPANDTATVTVTRVDPTTLPVVNDFQTSLLPTGWSLRNPDNDVFTWTLATPATKPGLVSNAAYADNYNVDATGTVDDLNTPFVQNTGLLATDSVLINFDLAYKQLNFLGIPIGEDRLQVLITTNCGATYTTLFDRAGAALANNQNSGLSEFVPTSASDYRRISLSIGQNIFTAGNFQVVFRNTNDWGNSIFLDNINVMMKPRKDLAASAIVRPGAVVCSPFQPSFTVRNNGGQEITAFKVGYILNGGTPVIQSVNQTLAGNATYTHTFPALTGLVNGTNNIVYFNADPLSLTPGPDSNLPNDTLRATFFVPTAVTTVNEGFEGATFAPANWLIVNPNNNNTWVKRAPGNNSANAAFIDNYSADFTGQRDALQAPYFTSPGTDGIEIQFDVAHKNYPGSLDSLQIFVSSDCGTTFTRVYGKAGAGLATAGSSTDNYVAPIGTDWRRERVVVPSIAGNYLIRFENKSDYGNNIFLDNINITP